MDELPRDPRSLPGEDALLPDTVTGGVVAGVEHGSVVLESDEGVIYQLGGRWQHLVGRRVAVTGHVRNDMMTTQQQGVLFAVQEVTDLGPGRVPPPSV